MRARKGIREATALFPYRLSNQRQAIENRANVKNPKAHSQRDKAYPKARHDRDPQPYTNEKNYEKSDLSNLVKIGGFYHVIVPFPPVTHPDTSVQRPVKLRKASPASATVPQGFDRWKLIAAPIKQRTAIYGLMVMAR
jgi:hypothetical protein